MTKQVANLDAPGVWSLHLSIRAGFKGFVEMVDGLTGGIFHRQQAVFSHPAPVEGVGLWVCSVHLCESLAQWESQGAAGGLVLEGTRGRGGREQDGTTWSAEWVDLAFTWISIAAAGANLGL